jgi:hypothetical protein
MDRREEAGDAVPTRRRPGRCRAAHLRPFYDALTAPARAESIRGTKPTSRLPMFRPPSIFFANRKVQSLRAQLANVGQPVSEATARQVVTLAWGWQSWDELLSALDTPGTPSPLDEELAGPDAKASAMALLNARSVGERGTSSCCAIRAVVGLPPPVCLSLSAFLRLTGRHPTGVWLTLEAYRDLHAASVAPRPDWALDLLDHRRLTRTKPQPFPLPPLRPR